MRITFKSINRHHIVTVNGTEYTFDTSKDALTFIFALHKVA